MSRPIYTAVATVSGGRQHGLGRSADGELDVQARAPIEGGGTNPEQLFAVGYAACFEQAVRTIGRRERAELGDVSIDSRVSLIPRDDRTFRLGVELHVTLAQVESLEDAKRYVAKEHRICPYSNATRGNIGVTLTANGETAG